MYPKTSKKVPKKAEEEEMGVEMVCFLVSHLRTLALEQMSGMIWLRVLEGLLWLYVEPDFGGGKDYVAMKTLFQICKVSVRIAVLKYFNGKLYSDKRNKAFGMMFK